MALRQRGAQHSSFNDEDASDDNTSPRYDTRPTNVGGWTKLDQQVPQRARSDGSGSPQYDETKGGLAATKYRGRHSDPETPPSPAEIGATSVTRPIPPKF